jgi:hypothetical protein
MDTNRRKCKNSNGIVQDINVAGGKLVEAAKKSRSEWSDGQNIIRLGAKHDHREWKFLDVVLLRQLFVHGKENVKATRSSDKAKQFSIVDARPASLRHGLNLVAGQVTFQTSRQTLIEKNAHLGGHQDSFAGLFKESNGLLAGHCGKIFQKLPQRFTAFNVINQGTYRHACARKARCAAHDLGVNLHDGTLFHASI